MRFLVLVAACVLCALAAIGFGLSLLFELQGFGGPRDEGPRPLYVSLHVAGLVACLVVPAALALRLRS